MDLDIDSDSDLDIEELQSHELQASGKAREAFESGSDSSINYRLPMPAETISSESTLSHLQTPFSVDSDSTNLEDSTSGQVESYPVVPHQGNIAPRASEISSEFSQDNIISEHTRYRQVYLTTLQELERLHAYLSTFATGLKYLYRD